MQICHTYERLQSFEWDPAKQDVNIAKHGISFQDAQQAFLDPKRVIAVNDKHSATEARFYYIGRVNDGILTVRFTWRGGRIRIIGAAYWREGRKLYEDQKH